MCATGQFRHKRINNRNEIDSTEQTTKQYEIHAVFTIVSLKEDVALGTGCVCVRLINELMNCHDNSM